MKRRTVILLPIASFPTSGQQKGKQENVTRIEVLEIKAERSDGRITMDGQVKNTGTRPLTRVVLMFDLLDADSRTISRRRGAVEEPVLAPGDEYTFHFYVADHARAVEVQVAAEQRGLEMEVVKAGPYMIE